MAKRDASHAGKAVPCCLRAVQARFPDRGVGAVMATF